MVKLDTATKGQVQAGLRQMIKDFKLFVQDWK